MNKYILVTESGSDLPQKYLDKYKIKIVQMHVTMGDETYDDKDVQVEKIFDYYDKEKSLATTSGATPGDFEKVFRQINEKNKDVKIIYIAYSSVTTVSFNSARLAAENFDNVYLIDSKNVSVGLGSLVIETAKFIEKNKDASPEDIIAFVEDVRERLRFIFLPQTLLFLRAGGRVSNAAYLGAILLRIFPTINIENGYLVAGKKYRGSFKIAYRKLINEFFRENDFEEGSIRLVKVPDLNEGHIKNIESLLSFHKIEDYDWFDTGSVIACHGGPGAMGISGILKK